MKHFILKSSFFFCLLSAVLFVFKSSVPYYWGNPFMGQKIESLAKDIEQYNVLFVGSSKVYRHIDPILFDEMTASNSYNLGGASVFYLESHYLLDHIFQKNQLSKPLKILMMHVEPLPMQKEQLHVVRHKYYLDAKRYWMGLSHFWQQRNFIQMRYLSLSFFENLLCIGELKAMLNYRSTKKPLPKLLEGQKGFYALDHELKLENTRALAHIRKQFLESQRVTPKRTAVPFEDQKLTIKPYFVQDLDTNHQYFTLSELELESDYLFDPYHYNSKGAVIYTKAQAMAFLELLEKENR